MTQTAKMNWNLVGTVLAAFASLATIGGYISSKDVRCTVAKLTSIESNDCKITSNLINVDFIVQTKERESVEGAVVTFIFKGAPETRTTNGQGYVKNKIPLREDVDIIISKDGYESYTTTLNLDPNRDDKPVIYQLTQKSKQTISSTPVSPSPNITAPSEIINPTVPEKPSASFKASISTDKAVYIEGEEIKIQYSGMPARYNDFIILTDASTPDDNYNNSRSFFTVTKKDGNLKFDSLPPGKYEIRAYYNYREGSYNRLIGRHPVTIK